MNRTQHMIIRAEKSATKTDKAQLFDMAVASTVEMDCLTEDIYIKEESADAVIELIGKGKCKMTGGKFPKRYVEDDNGTIKDKNNVKYRKMTVEDCGKTHVSKVKDTEITKEFLEAMTLANLKLWIKARCIDEDIDLRLTKANIILAVLKLENGESYDEEKEI